MPDARSPTAGAMSPPASSSQPYPPAKRPKINTDSSFTGSNSIVSSPQAFTPTQSTNATSSMPPPSSTSPISKPVDTNDLQDVLFSSGVDLKAEEQALADMNPEVSFNIGSFGGPENGSMEDWHQTAPREEMRANRQWAQESSKTRHQNDPFLERGVLRNRLVKKLDGNQMKMQFDPSDMETLVSMAAFYRLKELMQGASSMARFRRDGNSVIGLGEWAEMAVGEGERSQDGQSQQQDATTEAPETAVSPSSNPRKRSFSVANASSTPQPRKPKLISETARSLRALAMQERTLEEARLAARAHRNQNPGSAPQTPGADASSSGPVPGSVAPELGERKMSAKETRKINQAKIEEASSHRAANATASMMLGGSKKKKYSWLNPAPQASSVSASRSGTPVVSVPAAAPRPATVYWNRRLGEWNETGEKGKGIQLRDWVGALESDGREKKTLVKAFLKLK